MRRSLMVWPVVILLLLIPLAIWLRAVGDPRDYMEPGVPSGQFLYVLSKLFGLLGITCLGIQLVLILARTHSKTIRSSWPVVSHRVFGVLALSLIVLHAALFISAASLRSSHFAWSLLTLRWSNGYYDAMVSLGLISLCLLLVIALLGSRSGRPHSRTDNKRWHRMLVLLMLPLAMIHSFAIGSETTSWPVMVFYTGLCAAVLWSVFQWRKRRLGNRSNA